METKVSALICVKNSEETLEACLISLVRPDISDIIVIDGESIDNSVQIARKYTDLVFSDNGHGLGYARKLGVEKVGSKYLIIMGPDDVLAHTSLASSVDYLNENTNVAGILAHKRLAQAENFWERGQDRLYALASRRTLRVIGNPSLYRTSMLKAFEYDSYYSANEDTDLCERWWDAGYSVGWAPETFRVLESARQNRSSVYQRYCWYGRGDFDFVVKWLGSDWKKAMRHFFHPLLNYMIRQPVALLRKGESRAALFSLLAGIFRYIGFAQRIAPKRGSR
jgi:glycosyltransferase involved in cell wall biosynthesis